MATVQEPTRSAPRSKYDTVVEQQLDRVRNRIRTLDVTVGLLGFVAGTLIYALVLAALDRWLELSSLTRQLAFAGYALAALAYLAWAVVLPLTRRLNPYYAARQVEQAIPDAKNSVVNWLDLHDDNLPNAIHGALGARAARDLTQTDLEHAVSSRRAAWLGALVGGLFLTCLVLLVVWGNRPFLSLLGRSFLPFSEITTATRTRLTILRPSGGDAVVPVDQSVHFLVYVDGRVPEPGRPDSLKLLLRYQQGDPYEEQSLERETGREWITTVPAFRVQNGFFYKIKGGDAVTQEYHVRVRSTPLITGFEVAYHYREYLGFTDDVSRDPNLKAHRGTHVTVTARANRATKPEASYLELSLSGVKKRVPALPVDDDPQSLRFAFTIDQDGTYQIHFTTTEGEKNPDPMPYAIQAIPDRAPTIEITKPGEDVTLPVNGLLKLEGTATDDIGVAAITLRMRVEGGPTLQPKRYRDGKSFRLVDGSHPRVLEYRDFVELAKLVDVDGKRVTLVPKQVIEYWLEAADGGDYPAPHVAESKRYKVIIAEKPPLDQQQQNQQRQQAEQEQRQHEGQQDEQIARENEARKDAGNPKQGDNPDAKQQPQEGAGNAEGKPDPKREAEKKQQEELKRQEEAIRDALKKLEEEKAGAKGDPDPENKGNAKQEPKDPKQGEQPDAGQGKPGEQQQDNRNAGGAKGGAPQPQEGKQGDAGEAKDGPPQPMPGQEAGEPKGAGDQQGGAGDAESKPGVPDKFENQPGRGKDNGLPPEERLQRINDGDPSKGGERANSKDNRGAGEGDEPPAETKDDPKRLTRANNKDAGKEGKQPDGEPRGGSKGEGKPDANNPNRQAKSKPDGGDPMKKDEVARAEKKGDGDGNGEEKKPEEAKEDDVERLGKKSRDGKEKEKQEAKKKLEQVRDRAQDENAREAAKRELERLRKEQEPGLAKENDKPKDEKNGECAQCKGGGQGNGASKPGSGAQAKGGGGQGNEGVQPGEGRQGEKEGEGVAQGKAKGKGDDKDGEATAARPGDGPGGENAPEVIDDPDPLPKGPVDPEHLKKVAELQLEQFRNRVNKKVLDDAKISPEAFEKFLRGWVEMKRKQGLLPSDEEKLPAPAQGGGLPSVGASKVVGGEDRGGDVKAGARGQAPPEFREAFRKFTRDLSTLPEDPKR